jgi:hypothetical protein
MVLLRNDDELRAAYTCHPAIVEFLLCLAYDDPLCYKYMDVEALYAWCKSSRGDVFRVVDSWRTFAEQDSLYDGGKGKATHARGGESFHNWGLAVDVIPTRTGYDTVTYKGFEREMGAFFKECGFVAFAKHFGLRWGGDDSFYDPGHFECCALPVSELRLEKFAVKGWWDNPNFFTSVQKRSEGIIGGVVGFVREFWGGVLQAAGTAVRGEEPAALPAAVLPVSVEPKAPLLLYVCLGVALVLVLRGGKR